MVEPGESVNLAPDSMLSVAKTPHTTESLAVRIENRGRALCYTGDTGYDEELARFFSNAELLISECSFLEPREGVAHLSVNDVARLAARSEVAKLVVTHFYFDVIEDELRADLEAGFGGEVVIGRDGCRIEIP
jgi:ribonuclease BN (tRNA processing enzyme)